MTSSPFSAALPLAVEPPFLLHLPLIFRLPGRFSDALRGLRAAGGLFRLPGALRPLLRLPAERLEEGEVDAPFLQVDRCDLDADAVAEPELAAGARADERVPLLDVLVVVVVQGADVHEALDEEVVEEHEEAERAHAGDGAEELGAQVPLHELDLLQLDAGAR